MKKLFTLLLLLAALLSDSPSSMGQVIYSQNFDTTAYNLKKPFGWTDSIFAWPGYNSSYPYGYPTWYQDNLSTTSCTPVINGTQRYYYYPFGLSYPQSGPYGTTFGYTYHYPYPSSNSGISGCLGAGYMAYAGYYNGLQDYYITSYGAVPANFFPFSAEIASPALNLNAAYQANAGQGSIRLSFYLQTYYYYTLATNQVKVYINSVPVSAGGTLIDSIYPYNNPSYGYSFLWTQYQYTLPASFYTSTKAYIIFVGSVGRGALSGYYPYDLCLDDFAVTFIPPCPAPTQAKVPTNLTFTNSASIVNGSFTAPSPAPSGYLVIRSIGALVGAPANSTVYTPGSSFGANGTVVYAGSSTTFQDVSLTPGTAYTYTVYPYSSGSACTITYNSGTNLNPLVNTVTTGSTNIYTWNRTVTADFTVGTNWTPTRTVPDPTDILVFDNGISDTATNVPTQGVGTLNVANSTQAHLRSNTGTTFTVNTNGIANATGLNVQNGSGLILDGPSSPLTLAFGAGTLPNIAGNLEVANTGAVNSINFNNAITTVTTTGQLAAGGTNNSYPFVIPNAQALLINGTFNNKYTTVGGFIAYPATWGANSTVLITGYTTATAGPSSASLAQTFANFVYNASNQTSACNWSGNALNVTGTLNVTSTGTTGSWVLAGTQAYASTAGNFVQAGGIVDLASGVNATAGTQILTITGTVNQLGGTIKSSGSGTTQPILFFNGNTGAQSVTLSNSPLGPIVYRVGNGAGINLVGINNLGSTPILLVNSGGGIRISTTAANPINTTLLLQYATANSSLTFDTSGNITVTPAIWPASTPPFNVVVNVNTGNTVKVPFNAVIPGTLQFISGDVDMSIYNLTIGNSTLSTNQGTILEPTASTAYLNVLGNGNVRITSGSLTRWYGTAGLPVAATPYNTSTGLTSQGFFPVAFGASNRNAYVYFSAANALGSGGTITVSHSPTTNTSTLSPAVVDTTGSLYSMNVRTNASWTFTTSSLLTLNPGASMAIKATAGNLLNPINSNQLRMTHLTNDPGANGGAGGGAPNFTASRTKLQVSDLTNGPWYFAANTADINTGANGVYTAITTSNWTTAAAWDIGLVPGANNLAVINPGVTTTINSSACVAKALTVLGTINDNTAGNVLNVDSQLINNGVINVNGGTLLANTNGTANAVPLYSFVGIYNYGAFNQIGGTVTMGPTGGGNKPFQNYGGLTLGTGSNLTINGSFASLPGSFFTHSGGNMKVDGNAQGNLVNSVPHGRAVFSLATPLINFYNGNITIVDPHADTTFYNTIGLPVTFEYVSPVAAVYNDSSAHTIAFGDGISTDPGGTTRGFLTTTLGNVGLFNFSNLVINGGFGVNRAVTTYFGAVGVQNNMTINSGGEYQTSSRDLVINGNLTVNSGGKLTTDNTGKLTFGQLKLGGTSVPAAPVTLPQTLSGQGIFVNAVTNTANLGNIRVMSPPYVVFNTGSNLTFPSSDAINFVPVNNVPSRIIMQSGYLAETGASASSNNASATNGWVIGGYQKHAILANMGSANFTYPIGDSTRYTPVSLSGSGVNVTTAGDISISTNPAYASTLPFSTFNPLKVLNRTYTVNVYNGLALVPNSTRITFNWVPSDISAAANYQNFRVGVNPAGTSWYYPHSISPAATSITVDTLAATGLAGTYQVGEACPPTVITTQPLTTGACINANPVSLVVAATGASLQYQWYHNNLAIPGANSPTYTKSSPTYADTGTYFVVITGSCYAAVNSNVVKINAGGTPPITLQPISQGVCAGYPVTLSVQALNAISYRWQKNGTDIPGTLQANSPNLTINSITVLDTGRYRVIVGNACASDTSLTAVITILPLPQATINANSPLAFCQGNNVLLNANYAPGYTYQWLNDGVNIPGAVNAQYAAVTAANYSVIVTDGNSCSSTSTYDSVSVFPSPAVNVTPVTQTTFCSGGHVEIDGLIDPTYTYQWQLNGANIPGATLQNYVASASGNYSLKVTNIQNCSSTSAPVLVTSLTVPTGSIATSGSTSLCTGSNVLLTAPAGSGYTYQWYSNGLQITGATNISYTANTTGSYSVVISNGFCSDTTAAVGVTLYPLPANTVSYTTPTTFCRGGNVVLSAGTGSGLTYQWQKDGVNLTGSVGSTYTAALSGNYTCVIGNTGGCSETTTPVTVTVNPLPVPVITGGSGTILSVQSSFATYQWYRNGVPVAANGTSSSYTAIQDGSYTVYVTDNNGCGNMSVPYIMDKLSVQNVANGANVRLYPNPAKDIVYIDAAFTVNVSVNSLDGKELFSKEGAKSINIANLANGIYMIRISDVAGNLVSVEKLVKSDK